MKVYKQIAKNKRNLEKSSGGNRPLDDYRQKGYSY